MGIISRRQALALPAALCATAQNPPHRKSRRDSFFGIHFDLHPNATDQHLGRDLSPAHIATFLERVRPDFVQYDCKGHAGWLGYPSRVSRPAPGIVQDSLALWRKETAAKGVALYIHFSGVWDSLAIEDHPDWARLKPDNTRDDRQTSLWSRYAEDRMIPQLLEVSDKYQLDGAWIDGDCWQANPDYSPGALAAWRRLGLGMDAPRKPDDANWDVWLEFNRQRFRDYVRQYVDVLHRERPGFQIASNWLYSTFVPEKPELPVDFLSGDYLGNSALSRARLDARYLAQTGKPWDLMAWGFQISTTQPAGHVHKPAVQLEQEAAVVLAQGGGFQIYYQPSRAGRIDERHISVMARVGQFCRERQAICHRSESLSQAAILFSRTSLYRRSGKMFGGWGKHIAPCAGLLDALLEAQRVVDVVPDWADLNYPVLVIPEWEEIGEALTARLAAQVRQGLNLLITGVANTQRFAPHFQWKLMGRATAQPAFLPADELFGIANGLWQSIDPAGAQILANRHPTYDSSRDGDPAALSYSVGRGRVVVIPGQIGEVYDQTHTPALRELMRRCLDHLLAPQVRLADKTAPVELVLRKQGDLAVLHLLNQVNKQVAASYPAVDFIPSLPAQSVEWRLSARPRKLLWQPGGYALGFEWREGILHFETPPIGVHNMAVLS